MKHAHLLRAGVLTTLLTSLMCTRNCTAEDDAEFFEKRVRPLLASRCQSCHGSKASKGSLRLDSRSAVLRGGDSGPAAVAGDRANSELIKAVHYGEDGYKMPPTGKLSAAEIAVLEAWVERKLPWPAESIAEHSADQPFSISERKKHWCWQPLQSPAIPATSQSEHHQWAEDPIDAFILAGLEKKGLIPARDADRRTLFRRLAFVIEGIPPSPADVNRFVNDDRPQALEHAVDRLLASPRFGERWSRHWFDIVRYSETLGHEFDFNIPNAWRYRDYVIRAINSDLPYRDFLAEHLIGDLPNQQRLDPLGRTSESTLATGFWFMGEAKQAPVDVRAEQADRIDNQIDVLSKAFLGLTVACARCHDHKFDAISTQDYYALYGFLEGVRYSQSSLTPKQVRDQAEAEIRHGEPQFAKNASLDWAEQFQAFAIQFAEPQSPDEFWQAAQRLAGGPIPRESKRPLLNATLNAAKQDYEERLNLSKWGAAHRGGDIELLNPLQPLGWKEQYGSADRFLSNRGDLLVAAREPSFAPFSLATRLAEQCELRSDRFSTDWRHALRSKSFRIDKPYLHVFAGGRDARLNVVVENFVVIQDPIYGGLRVGLDGPMRWHIVDLRMWLGRNAYLEFLDLDVPDLGAATTTRGNSSAFFSARRVLASDQPSPPGLHPSSPGIRVSLFSLPLLLEAIHAMQAYARESGRVPTVEQISAINSALEAGILWTPTSDATLESLIKRRGWEKHGRDVGFSPAAAEGDGQDEHIFIRGNHKKLGGPAHRSFLKAFEGTYPAVEKPDDGTSGRIELANSMLDNPLTRRVAVNRVWAHVFGRGLVATPDNFGVLGESPTHPELLDYLANDFKESNLSIKQLVRRLVLTRTFRLSSVADKDVADRDPENQWFSRARVRRLEAEAIRDSILHLGRGIDQRFFGPSTLIALASNTDGRGKPQSGPLDGDGRRSVYLGVRRNFLSPMLLAFDAPQPTSSIGRRSISNVPSQALVMLNDPFTYSQAEKWATRVMSASNDDRGRFTTAVLSAFGRLPTETEWQAASAYLAARRNQPELSEHRHWSDVCHSLFNSKEFLFVR